MDLLNIVTRAKKREISFQVQPFVRSSAHGSIIKIETVDIDDGARFRIGVQKSKGQSYRLPNRL